MKKHDDITKDVLYDLYINKMLTLDDVCKKLNITIGSLAYLLNKYKITKRDTNTPRISGITKDDLFDALYVKKLTNPQIMEKFGICESSIRNLCKYFGIPKRWESLRSYRSQFHSEIIRLYTEEMCSLTVIRDKLNIPKTAIRKILINSGVSLRKKNECQFSKHYQTNIKWLQPRDNLRKRCRAYFSNHLIPKYKKAYCEECKSTELLCVHHKISLSIVIQQILNEHLELDIITNENELFELIKNDPRFLDPTNLMTLCEECHYTKYHPEANYVKWRQSAAKPHNEEGSTTIESIA